MPSSRPRHGGGQAQIDPESLERENDGDIGLMEDKAKQLREVAGALLGEVKTQVGMLDRIGDSTSGANDMLKSSLMKFNKVFSNSENRVLAWVVSGCIVLFVLCYWLFK